MSKMVMGILVVFLFMPITGTQNVDSLLTITLTCCVFILLIVSSTLEFQQNVILLSFFKLKEGPLEITGPSDYSTYGKRDTVELYLLISQLFDDLLLLFSFSLVCVQLIWPVSLDILRWWNYC